MVASELSRADSLARSGGGPEVEGCLARARELLGVLESCPTYPPHAAAVLAEAARGLCERRLSDAPAKAGPLYQRLMALYKAG